MPYPPHELNEKELMEYLTKYENGEIIPALIMHQVFMLARAELKNKEWLNYLTTRHISQYGKPLDDVAIYPNDRRRAR
jgi:predicted transcriptional regulator